MSRVDRAKIPGDPTPVTGVDKPPARVLRPVPGLAAEVPGDALGKHIARLLALHEKALAKHRGGNLNTMDDVGKRALLDEINRTLGIEPIKPPNGVNSIRLRDSKTR